VSQRSPQQAPLSFHQVDKVYRGRRGARCAVLRDLSWSLSPETAVMIRGPNGCGKSTLLGIAVGLIRPTGGTVRTFGLPAGHPDALRRIGWCSEAPAFREDLAVEGCLREHLRAFGIHGSVAARRSGALLERVGLDAVRDRPVGKCSAGMRRRLALARAVSHEPELLMLDEPFAALDEKSRPLVGWAVRSTLERGGAAVIVSHIDAIVEGVSCERWRLAGGKLVQEHSEAEAKSWLHVGH